MVIWDTTLCSLSQNVQGGHNNIICKSLRIFPFKKRPYKNVQGNKNNTEEVFDGIFSDYNSDKRDLLSVQESEDNI